MQAELHGEVGDARVADVRVAARKPGFAGHVGVEGLQDSAQVSEVGAVDGELVESPLGEVGECLNGVVVEIVPEIGIEAAEKLQGVAVPGPPDVVGQLADSGERLGKGGDDGVGSQLEHGRLHPCDSSGGYVAGLVKRDQARVLAAYQSMARRNPSAKGILGL